MFESIRSIGEALLQQGAFSFDIVQLKIRKKKNGGEPLLVRIIFDLDNKKLDCDPYLKCNERRLKEFLWVGNARSRDPQLVLTTNNPEYLLNPGRKNKWAIGQILEKVNERKIEDNEVAKLCSILREIKRTFFTPPENLTKEMERILEKKAKGGQAALYTVSVKKNSKLIDLVKTNGYRKLLYYVLYETDKLIKGRCHICGEEKEVLFKPAYPKGTVLCIYNIDKIGFISDLKKSPENLLKTHAVCVDCKMKLRLGLRYIERELKTKIGKLNMFVIPTFIETHTSSKILNMLPKLRDAVNVIVTYEKLEEIEKTLDELRNRPKQQPFTYVINILFGKSEGSHFAYQHLIQNVPTTRLLEVGEAFIEASKKFTKTFDGEPELWKMSLMEIYKIFPLKISKKDVEWKSIVELFDAILSGRPYPTSELIKRAVLFAKIHRHGTYELYNIRRPETNADLAMCRGLLKYILLLNVLRNIGVVEMTATNLEEIDLPDEDIKNFLKEQKFEEWQAALFLLGVLVGKIGAKQYKRGDEKKSVLDKIGFDGTSADRIKVLANYVLGGLRHYKILNDENEKLYGCMKALLDRNVNRLQNPIDNTFYLLSGYAYITMKTITSGGGA